MGGNKLCFVQKRRCNEQCRDTRELEVSIPVKHIVDMPTFCVSMPISVYFDRPVDSCTTLCSRMSSFPLPPGWIVHNSSPPLTICKLQTTGNHPTRVGSIITLSVGEDMKCEWTFIHHKLDARNCKVFSELPATISTTTSIGDVLSLVDTCTQCVGNPDTNLVDACVPKVFSYNSWKQWYCKLL